MQAIKLILIISAIVLPLIVIFAKFISAKGKKNAKEALRVLFLVYDAEERENYSIPVSAYNFEQHRAILRIYSTAGNRIRMITLKKGEIVLKQVTNKRGYYAIKNEIERIG